MTEHQTDAPMITREYWRRFLRRAVAAQSKSDQNRGAPRYPFHADITVLFQGEDGPSTRSLILVNVSAEGMTARGASSLPVETEVSVELNPEGTPLWVRGRVVHCTETVGGFKIGIRLEFADESASSTLKAVWNK